MPLRPFNDLGDLNLRAMQYRNEQLRNDLSNFYSGAKNAALSGIAGFAGQLGDFEGLIQKVLASPLAYAKPNKQQIKPPTSEEVAKYIGADLNTPSGWVGQIGMPDAGDLLKIVGLGVKGAMVFAHGSPHKFDRFDFTKMGTGEGGQWFGYGGYLAENTGVGRKYQIDTAFANTKRNFLDALPEDAEVGDVMELIGTGTFSPEQEAVMKALNDDDWLGFDYPAQAISAAYGNIDDFDPSPALRDAVKNSGHLYEVDVPDEAINKMLDWDKPLGEQEGVMKALSGRQVPMGMTGGEYYRSLIGEAVNNGKSKGVAKKEASEMLNSLGIPGIRYFDEGSRKAREGTRNFVIFDENLMTILSRDGKPIK